MRGPFWIDGRTEVGTHKPLGEEYSKTHPHVETYTDDQGRVRTRINKPED